MEGRALQDVAKVHCFGCGALNPQGLQIKSHIEGDEVVCRWQPPPHHIGHPGIVYGGTIASIVDCHSIWTAVAMHCRDAGIEVDEGPPFVTGKLSVSYLKPAAIDKPLELRARVTDRGEKRVNVACRVLQDGVEVANAEVVTVRVKR
jgi:acyl-coenzyme A thioesterase PaaI-like protein